MWRLTNSLEFMRTAKVHKRTMCSGSKKLHIHILESYRKYSQTQQKKPVKRYLFLLIYGVQMGHSTFILGFKIV